MPLPSRGVIAARRLTARQDDSARKRGPSAPEEALISGELQPASRSPHQGPSAGPRRLSGVLPGTGAPAAAPAHSAATATQPRRRRPTCTQTSSVGRCVSYWSSPTAPCRASSTHSTVSGRCTAGRRRARRASHHTATASRLNTSAISAWRWITKSIVPRPSKSRRLIFCPGEPPACGPGGGGGGAGEDRQRAEAPRAPRSRPHERADRRPRRRRARARRLMRGPPDEHHGRHEDQHRQREVAHHPAVVERALDGEAAEHRLADHAQRQQRRRATSGRAGRAGAAAPPATPGPRRATPGR